MRKLRPGSYPLDAVLTVLEWAKPLGVLLVAALAWWTCIELVAGPVEGWNHFVRRALCSGLVGSITALVVAMIDQVRWER